MKHYTIYNLHQSEMMDGIYIINKQQIMLLNRQYTSDVSLSCQSMTVLNQHTSWHHCTGLQLYWSRYMQPAIINLCIKTPHKFIQHLHSSLKLLNTMPTRQAETSQPHSSSKLQNKNIKIQECGHKIYKNST